MMKNALSPRLFVRSMMGALIAAAATFSSGAHAASATASGTADILAPLTLVRTADLAFGTVTPGAAGGTVTIDPSNNNRNITGTVTGVTSTHHAATFRATGVANAVALVSVPVSTTLTRAGGGATMLVTAMTVDGAGVPLLSGQLPVTLGTGGTLDINVGGTLAVAGNQMAGDYSGTFTVTVIYL